MRLPIPIPALFLLVLARAAPGTGVPASPPPGPGPHHARGDGVVVGSGPVVVDAYIDVQCPFWPPKG